MDEWLVLCMECRRGYRYVLFLFFFFFFQAEDGIRDHCVTGVQTCALPIWRTIRTQPLDPAVAQPVLFEPDPLALAVTLEPEIIQRSETQYVEIELAGQLTDRKSVV